MSKKNKKQPKRVTSINNSTDYDDNSHYPINQRDTKEITQRGQKPPRLIKIISFLTHKINEKMGINIKYC